MHEVETAAKLIPFLYSIIRLTHQYKCGAQKEWEVLLFYKVFGVKLKEMHCHCIFSLSISLGEYRGQSPKLRNYKIAFDNIWF
jgi:hypothetical protein